MLDYVVEKFKEMYQPGQNICIDGTGYCLNMWPYVGVSSTLPEIVFTLLDHLSGHGYTLYMDNFYNSIELCEHLLEH